MSRIGKKIIAVPKGVEIKIDGTNISVKGPKGTLTRTLPHAVNVSVENGSVQCTVENQSDRSRALWGLYRVLINNMITGVTQGYKKDLEIVGVGYKAELKGKNLMIVAGLSHPVLVKPAPGITFGVEGATKISVEGADKELVGRYAADIRIIRPPEPYKGKGIRYSGEHIIRKAGKAAGK